MCILSRRSARPPRAGTRMKAIAPSTAGLTRETGGCDRSPRPPPGRCGGRNVAEGLAGKDRVVFAEAVAQRPAPRARSFVAERAWQARRATTSRGAKAGVRYGDDLVQQGSSVARGLLLGHGLHAMEPYNADRPPIAVPGQADVYFDQRAIQHETGAMSRRQIAFETFGGVDTLGRSQHRKDLAPIVRAPKQVLRGLSLRLAVARVVVKHISERRAERCPGVACP